MGLNDQQISAQAEAANPLNRLPFFLQNQVVTALLGVNFLRCAEQITLIGIEYDNSGSAAGKEYRSGILTGAINTAYASSLQVKFQIDQCIV